MFTANMFKRDGRIPKTFIMDVDGVLSTGQFLYSDTGKRFKIFGPHDNDGIKLLKPFINIQFISADKRGFNISQARCNDLGVELSYVTEEQRFNSIKEQFGFETTIYMGDGIHDAPLLKEVYFGIAPDNARPEACKAANFITQHAAGDGAVLDACLIIQELFFAETIFGRL